ncbi:MAG: EamA family transporter [candidate division Zixibacteria bacterium]|nr:EamA family transporter [candidate division Zixibacteria bacterium]
MILAFAAIYLIWGSTYLGIRFAIETIPPFLMAGVRFLLGGLLFYMWARLRGETFPTFPEIRRATLTGLLMMVGATGAVTWAEQIVPSGLTALMVGTLPLWIALFNWLRPHGQRPTQRMLAGMGVGTLGVAFLVLPGHFAGADHVSALGAGVLITGCALWAIGSLYSSHSPAPQSQTMSAAIQLLVSFPVLIILSGLSGEWRTFDIHAVSFLSVASMLYLAVFGTLAFASYLWLLRASTPSRAATYAYVNPIVAVLLGSTLGDEPFALRTALTAVIIIGAVFLILSAKSVRAKLATPQSDPVLSRTTG